MVPPARDTGFPPARTAFVILEYCGGARTDALAAQLGAWNPGHPILVLDNASPRNRATSVTHRNETNSYIGGGIRDSIALAESLGADYLFYCVNDVEFADPLVIADFEALMTGQPNVVQVSASLTPDSDQAGAYPWMVRLGKGARQVRLADLVCCLLRLDFIRGFGGFPPSKGGWGYTAELAYHARLAEKKILVDDRCSIRAHAQPFLTTEAGEVIDKNAEAIAVYAGRHGGFPALRAFARTQFCDETRDILQDAG